MKYLEAFLDWGGIKKEIALLVISAVALIGSLAGFDILPFNPAWIAVFLCGIPIVLSAFNGLITSFDIKADVPVSIALVASIFIGEIFAAGEVAFIMQLGALLEELTVSKARAGIEKLVHLTPETGRRISGGKEEIIPADKIQAGDILRVLPGETIPVDGIIISGQTSVNQAVMTGESLPVDKNIGDEVSSGTVNQFGAFDMKAVKVGEDSSIRRMIRLVQSADAGKAKIVGIADRWATWIVVTALISALSTWFITKEIIRAVTILVVFCPCALVLATPTAIMAAIGNATKHGFLVREGDALERLSSVSKITFDKTGTLTYGKLRVEAACPSAGNSLEGLYNAAASIESLSEHPLAKAVAEGYRKDFAAPLSAVNNFRMIPGRGVEGEINSKKVIAGNIDLMNDNKIEIPPEDRESFSEYQEKGSALILVAENGVFSGFFALSDTLRENAAETLSRVKQTGVEPVLLTGDHKNAAEQTAKKLGITEVYSDCLPEDKLEIIGSFQDGGKKVCMIGDGINDAPALKKAFVGIAMGGIGSDIAVEAADIALVNDDIKEIPHLLLLAKRTMVTIKCNLSFSMILNFAAIILAMTGILNPVAGALVHNAGSVAVIVNSALLLRWKKRKP